MELDEIMKPFYQHCLSFVANDIVRLRSELISNPRRDLEIIGFGLHEPMHGLKGDLADVLFMNTHVRLMGQEVVVMRQRSLEQIVEGGMADLVRRLGRWVPPVYWSDT